MTKSRCAVHWGDVYFGSPGDFHPGVPLTRIHIVCIFFHMSKNILFPFAHDCCRLMVLFVMLTAVVLSQCTGIFGCGWPRSSRVDLNGIMLPVLGATTNLLNTV
jgi:hypothetical protein